MAKHRKGRHEVEVGILTVLRVEEAAEHDAE